MATRASGKGSVSYSFLHNLSSVDVLFDESKKKPRTRTVGVFEAEHVIARRKDRKGSIKYLVKWKGYSSFENTWEPEEHLSPASLRYFTNPHPTPTIVKECLDRLRAMAMVALKHKWVREDRTKVGNYAELTIPSYLIDDFQRFFRISRGTFEVILRNIAVYLTPDIGRAAITPEKHLLITIWFISHQDTIHRMSDRFSVTDSSIIRCRDRVFTVVLRYLKTKFIYLPKDYNVKVQIMDEYRIGSQFPNMLGAID
ncbi:Hypothetical predicted protein, partial [Paramuricea clavata]